MQPTRKLPGLLLGALVAALLPAPGASAAEADTPEVFRFHGGGYDQAAAMTVDDAGNVYIGGAVDSTVTEVTFAVVKLSPTGAVRWTAHYNGSLGGVGGSALAVAVDAAGNVYAAGSIADGDFYPNFDYLVVAFTTDGTQRWAHRFNGPGDNFDRATEIAVDDTTGAVYTSGTSYTASPNFTFDWSTRKFSATGQPLWERRHPGTGTTADRVADMVLAPDGNVVVSGITRNLDNAWANDFGTVTYDVAGNVVWDRRWNTTAPGNGFPRDMEIDPVGRITITGTVGDFPPSPVTLRYDRSGTLLQTIHDGGGSSVDVDGAGNFYLAGSAPDPTGSSFLARYDSSGTRIWATSVSVGGDEAFHTVFARADSTGAVTAAGTIRNILVHNDDYLVVRFAPDGRELWRFRFNGPIGGDDRVAGLSVDSTDAAIVTGTSWNDYLSNRGGTADDIVTLRFAAADVPPLLAPTSLLATGISRSQIQLTWTDNAGTEDGFRIERCQGTGCADFALIATVGHDVTSHTDQGLARNTRYSYRVQAFNDAGGSDYSNVATGKTRQR